MTEKPEWPLEPWEADPEYPGEPEFVSADGNTYSIHDNEPQFGRMIACVNALAGVRNPAGVKRVILTANRIAKSAQAGAWPISDRGEMMEGLIEALAKLDQEPTP